MEIEVPTDPPIEHHSDWLPLILVSALLLVSVLLLLSRYGNIKSQAWYVTAVCTLGWFLPFWIVFLLPLDLASTVHDELKGRIPFAYVSQPFLFIAWRVIYWTNFCLTWLTIPMMQAYVNTGEFTIAKRLKQAVQVNLKFYSIYIVVGAVGLVYLVFGSGLTTRQGIQSYVMAAANSWGLFLVIVFMGYGLVSVPRTLWYSGNYDRHLHQHYANAARLKEECMDSELEFTDLAKTMNAISKRSRMETTEVRYCIEVMTQRFPFVLHEAFDTGPLVVKLPRDLTEDYLVKLSRRMILAIRMRDRKKALWQNLLKEAFYLQDIVSNKDKQDRQFTSTLRRPVVPSRWNTFVLSTEWWWELRILPNLNKILAILLSIISLCMIFSELVFNVRRPAIISIVYYALNACGSNYAALEIMAFIILMYMVICVFSALFKIRFFNLYILIPNHHTDENSLLWFTSYMCKMMAPLCYNFINLGVDAPGVSKAVFTTFMGKADVIKFLGAFADWFPIIILIPSLSLFFNNLGICGIRSPYQNNNDTESNSPLLDADIEEGQRLVLEERRLREREINPNSRVSINSARNREYVNKKYARGDPSDTLRHERDRRVDEILSGRHTPYRDSPESSTSVTDQQSLGENLKHKLNSLISSMKKSDQPITSPVTSPVRSPIRSPLRSPVLSPARSPSPTNRFTLVANQTSGGRVFGRPATNENYRPFQNTYAVDHQSGSRPTSPNPFISSLGHNNQPNAKSHNVFDDI